MKKILFFGFLAFLFILGCSKSDDLRVNPNENQLKSARTATPINANGFPPYSWDNTDVLQTSIWKTLKTYVAPPGYPEYVASNYDVMAHFQYYSIEAVKDALIEFTFPHIIDFVPHMLFGRTYTVNNKDNITVISCITDLNEDSWNDMFCFMVKVDCSQGNSGYTTFWTDMKVNGVSVKGTIKNKVFACN